MAGKRLHKYVKSFNTTVVSPTEPERNSTKPSSGSDSSSPSTPVHTPGESPSHMPASKHSGQSTPASGGTSSSAVDTTPKTTKKRSGGPSPPTFVLPKYDAALERALSQDSIYDSSTRAKLVRKSCEHLEGCCLEHGLAITKEQQDNLAHLLLARAPNSLGDPPGVLKGKHSNDKAISS